MSLINDALKKTQRDRASGETSVEPPMPGGAPRARIAKRAAPMPAQKLVLIIASIVVLVVLSAVGTALWLNRKPTPSAVAAAKPLVKPDPAPSPVIITPVIAKPAAAEPEPAATLPAPAAIASATSPSIATLPPAAAAQSLANVTPPPPAAVKPAPATPTPAAPDPRVQAFVDAVRMSSIFPAGGRVLMNDRVFRVNDIVDRPLGVRLIAVDRDSLTFADANGMTYVRNF